MSTKGTFIEHSKNEEHFKILQQGVDTWNRWREESPGINSNLTAKQVGQKKIMWRTWRIYRKEQLGLNTNHRFYSIEQKWMTGSSVVSLPVLSLGIYWLFFSNPPSTVMGISSIIFSLLVILEQLPIRKFTIQLPDTKLETAKSQENIIIGFGPFAVFHKEIDIKKVQILVVRHKEVSIERTSYEPGERSRYQISVVTNSNEHKITPLGQFENMLSLQQLVVDFLKNMALLKSKKSYINDLIFQAVRVDINDEIEPAKSRRHFLEWVEQNELNITYDPIKNDADNQYD